MSGVWHALLLIGMGIAIGAAIVNVLFLLLCVVDVVAAGEQDHVSLWPDPRSLTVWTGEDWFTATVMPVAFGRWGIAMCRDQVPRRPCAFELVERVRTEPAARRRAHELIGQALGQGVGDRVAVAAG